MNALRYKKVAPYIRTYVRSYYSSSSSLLIKLSRIESCRFANGGGRRDTEEEFEIAMAM